MSGGGKRKVLLEYLKDTILAKITVVNGYNLTLKTKERGLRHPEEMKTAEFPAVFIASADEDSEDVTNKHFKSVISVYFHCFVSVAENSRVQPELDKLIEDVTRAVYEGPTPGGSDPTHGGKVTWTKRRTVKTDMGDNGPNAEAVITFDFLYMTQWSNP